MRRGVTIAVLATLLAGCGAGDDALDDLGEDLAEAAESAASQAAEAAGDAADDLVDDLEDAVDDLEDEIDAASFTELPDDFPAYVPTEGDPAFVSRGMLEDTVVWTVTFAGDGVGDRQIALLEDSDWTVASDTEADDVRFVAYCNLEGTGLTVTVTPPGVDALGIGDTDSEAVTLGVIENVGFDQPGCG